MVVLVLVHTILMRVASVHVVYLLLLLLMLLLLVLLLELVFAVAFSLRFYGHEGFLLSPLRIGGFGR